MNKIAFFLILLAFCGCSKDDDADITDPNSVCNGIIDDIKINEFQHIGSHNSYRKRTYEPILQTVLGLSLANDLNAEAWEYDHLPLEEQLSDYGMRSFEIDIYYDPLGGQFYNRGGLEFVMEDPASMIPELLEPGFKVFHLPDLDYETNYYTFKSVLTTVKSWSLAHPNHIPIYVMVEPKEESIADYLSLSPFVQDVPFTQNGVDSLEQEIVDIFGPDFDQLLTPDDLRKDYATINEAILDGGWPTLKEARGKIILVMMGGNSIQDFYKEGDPNLEGKAMFLFSDPGEPEAAFIKRDGPQGNEEDIKNLVSQGYMIRTRADADTEQARTGDYSRMESAFISGAQLISTDYYRPEPKADTSSEWTNYVVQFPNNELSVINPVNGPEEIDCLVRE